MQSFLSSVLCSVMKLVFHSPLMDRTKMSDNAGKITKERRSHYRPSKGYTYSRHATGEAFYEITTPENITSDKAVLMLHGGSYKVKLIDMYRKLAEKYSKLLGGAIVYSLDYRTFPQYKFPSQIEDFVSLYRLILSEGISPDKLVVIGDSAGANLAFASSLWLRDNGFPLPGHIVSFSLWGDATSSGESKLKNAYRDPIFGIPKSKRIEDSLEYLQRISSFALELDRNNPYVSPCFGDFTGFNKVTLVCGEAELDESDNDRIYERLRSAGVDAVLYKFDGMFHDFQLIPFLPESKKAYRLIKERVEEE